MSFRESIIDSSSWDPQNCQDYAGNCMVFCGPSTDGETVMYAVDRVS